MPFIRTKNCSSKTYLMAVKSSKVNTARTALLKKERPSKTAETTSIMLTNKTDVYAIQPPNYDSDVFFCIKPGSAKPEKISTKSNFVRNYELQPGIPTPVDVEVEVDEHGHSYASIYSDGSLISWIVEVDGKKQHEEGLIISYLWNDGYRAAEVIFPDFPYYDEVAYYRAKEGSLPKCP